MLTATFKADADIPIIGDQKYSKQFGVSEPGVVGTLLEAALRGKTLKAQVLIEEVGADLTEKITITDNVGLGIPNNLLDLFEKQTLVGWEQAVGKFIVGSGITVSGEVSFT